MQNGLTFKSTQSVRNRFSQLVEKGQQRYKPSSSIVMNHNKHDISPPSLQIQPKKHSPFFSLKHNNKNKELQSIDPFLIQQQQSIKNLLLDRFRQKKQVLFQSSSIYIDTGEIKKKHHSLLSDSIQSNVLSLIKESSFQKLPHLSNEKQKSKNKERLSQTIDVTVKLSKQNDRLLSSSFSQIDKVKSMSFHTIGNIPHSNMKKAKLHLSKRKSLNQNHTKSRELSISIDSGYQSRIKQQYDRETSPINQNIQKMGFDQESKRKYLKSIVDRYFPNDQSHQYHKGSSDSRSINSQRNKSFGEQSKPSKTKRQPRIINVLEKLPELKRNSKISQAKQEDRSKKDNLSNPYNKNLKQSFSRFKDPSPCQLPSSHQRQNSPSFTQVSNHLQLQRQNPSNILIKSTSSALSLSQSYLLQKIQEDEELVESQQVEDVYNSQNSNSLFFPTHLSHAYSSESIMNSSGNELVNMVKQRQLSESQSLNKFQQSNKQQRQKLFQNHSFCVYKIKYTSFQNISQNSDLKTLNVSYEFRKYFLNEASMELKKRELKAKGIIQNRCEPQFAGSLWEQDIFDKNCLKMNLTKNSLPSVPGPMMPLTLSKMLYKISPQQVQSGSSRYLLIKPTSQQQSSRFVTQYSLLSNSHYGLLSLISSLSSSLSALSQNLINNKLSMNNIFYLDFNRYTVNQWGYSYLRQEYQIQDKKFEKRLEPILKNEFNEWFITPEYLAPEILENLCFYTRKGEVIQYWVKKEGKKMQKSIVQEHDLFQYGNKADVWSLGLLILEIITLIPVWIGQKCMVQNKKNPNIQPRNGFLYSQKRDLLKILTKQSYLKENLNKILRIQSQPFQIEEWLVKLLSRMLELDSKKRISFAEILEIIKEQEKIEKAKQKHFK